MATAEEIYTKILAAKPDYPGALHMLGVLREQQRRHDEARDLIGRAVAKNPANPIYHNNYGAVLHALGRHQDAAAEFAQALALSPNYADAFANQGMAMMSLGHDDAALASLRRALELQPGHVDALRRSATVLKKLGRTGQAMPLYERAIAAGPTARMHVDFGELLVSAKSRDRVIEQYRRALVLDSNLAEAHVDLGAALTAQGKVDEAEGHLRRAVELRPDSAVMHSNWVYCQQYRETVTPESLSAAHAEWDERHGAPLKSKWKPALAADAALTSSTRPLRLGFVSRQFRLHPVGCMTVQAIEFLKKQRKCTSHAAVEEKHLAGRDEYFRAKADENGSFPSPLSSVSRDAVGKQDLEYEIICYSDTAKRDAITERFIAAADSWHQVEKLSDDALADQIRRDYIDILFDLGGHLGGNRLLLFARKPAAVQVKWVGYPGSSGLTAMDYLFGRPISRAGPATRNTAQKRSCGCRTAISVSTRRRKPPEVCPLPAREKGRYVTFGCVNNPAKVTPRVVATWAEILRRVPGSRLRLQFAAFEDAGTKSWYQGLFAANGIGADRIDFQGWAPRAEMLADYNRIDIALDPFPYSGGITTCEALWMGVPVITFPGRTFAGRHSLSHLSNVDFTETVVKDLPGYIALAVQLAGDLDRLSKLRAELRPRMAKSPLCDGPRFAENLMELLHTAWQEHHSNSATGVIAK